MATVTNLSRRFSTDSAPNDESPSAPLNPPDAPPIETRRAREVAPTREPSRTPRPTPSVTAKVRSANREPASPASTPTPAPKLPPPVKPGMTIGIKGFDIQSLNIAKRNYLVKLPDQNGDWVHPLFSIVGTGKSPVIGRNEDPRLEMMKTLAVRHVRFENTSRGLFVKPFDSLNGVYRRINGPVELTEGARFRIGNYIMTYCAGQEMPPAETVVFEGEHFLARDIQSHGEIEFIRPDGQPGVKFPLLKPTATILGRGGPVTDEIDSSVDIPLRNDLKVSPRHARIRFSKTAGTRPILEDLESKSGTWIDVSERTEVKNGDEFWLGELYIKVVEDN